MEPNNTLNSFGVRISSPIAQPSQQVPGFTMSGLWERGGIRAINLGSAIIGHAQIGTAAIGTANIGTLTFNQITGGTAILGGTANGNGLLNVYDATGSLVSQLDNTGMKSYGSSSFTFYDSSAGLAAFIGPSGGNILISTAVGVGFKVSANGNTTFQQGGASQFDFAINCANFKVNGTTKSAIVDTSEGYKALYCTESPEVWFMDFCEAKDKLDPLFKELTEAPYHYIKCEDGEYQVWGKRKGFSHLRFEDKTEEQFYKNTDFWSTPNK